jgi:D-aminopeptidase
MAAWMLEREGMENVRSINPVVGETNDGGLNDIRARPIRSEHVVAALESAVDGPVEEGAVGAGTGTVAFGWKGGIGTSSRVLPEALGGYSVGVLVQSNFGGILQMNGAPVGVELGQYAFADQVRPPRPQDAAYDARADVQEWGSIMMVVATDAPLSDRNLERVARRAIMGLARTGSYASNGSGDYVIAFSTANGVRRGTTPSVIRVDDLHNEQMSGLFEATVEATEEAIYNSLLKAVTVTGNGRTVEALPLEATLEVLRKYGAIR